MMADICPYDGKKCTKPLCFLECMRRKENKETSNGGIRK
jgi:hypothetical protein